MDERDYNILRGRLDALDLLIAEKRPPWYRQASTLVSLLALVLSLITSYFSFRFQNATDIRAKKQQLRDTIVSLIDLNAEGAKMMSDPVLPVAERSWRMAALADKAGLLIGEAQNTLDQLPSREITPAEFGILAMASIENGDPPRGIRYLNKAITASRTFTDQQTSRRNLASFYMRPGPYDNFTEAEKLFKQAVDEANPNDSIAVSELAVTYAAWGSAETERGSAADGKTKFDLGRGLCNQIKQNDPMRRGCLEMLNRAASGLPAPGINGTSLSGIGVANPIESPSPIP